MSIPGDQPNPYAQSQSNPYGDVPPQPPGGQQQPGQQDPRQAPNPYAYPPTPAGPQPGPVGAAAHPTMPGGVPTQPPGQVPGQAGHPMGQPQPPAPYPGQVPAGYGPGVPTPSAPSGSTKGRGLLWAAGGAVVASALWAGGLLATGGFGDDEAKADLAGYQYTGNLCGSTDYAPFEEAGFKKDESTSGDKNPRASGTEHEALDSMDCNTDLKASESSSSSDYSSTWVATSAHLHHKTDPEPEFEARYRAYENQKGSTYTYKVKPVPDLGDEAYLVTQEEKDGDDEGSYVILAVRDGWMTYQTSWSNYVSGSSNSTPPNSEKVGKMLSQSAKVTMERLQR
ncbi:hypothetical protein [Streptomyces zagrosensis]|uniref:Basic proline-rich protein n=1 Tax=Streptomyces zagrosensis TaxID=1042984 RepID=A0A7W9Q428_9ACTN|nr:hypothetical protein [Streptomyces zagrosensis]MBB5933021.1 hypothetical protein [Streptomyces zagrosensis]